MELKSKEEGAFRQIERVMKGEEIYAGERCIRPILKCRVLIGPGGAILSIRITPMALIISDSTGQYAIFLDGEPAEAQALLEMMS